MPRLSHPIGINVVMTISLFLTVSHPSKGSTSSLSSQLGGGVAWVDHDPLNDRLKKWGYSPVGNPYVPIDIFLAYRPDRFVFGVESMLYIPAGEKGARNNMEVDVSAVAMTFQFGYDVLKWRELRLYPLIGVGFNVLIVDIYSKDEVEFDDLVGQEHEGTIIGSIGLILDAMIALEYQMEYSAEMDYRKNIIFGLRGGLIYTPIDLAWNSGGSGKVSNAPDFRLTGPAVMLTVGIESETFNY